MLPLSRSTYPFCVGFPGWIKNSWTLLSLHQWSSFCEINSGPLSTRIISGKPLVSYQAYAPVGFGIAVLLSAIGTVVFLSLLNRMPRLFHPVFFSDRFRNVTDDSFFVSVEAGDPNFDVHATTKVLESAGGKNIEILQG